MTRHAAALAVLLAAVGLSEARAEGCTLQGIEVRLAIKNMPPREDTSRSAAALLALAGPEPASRHNPTLAAVLGTLGYAIEIAGEAAPDEAGLYCIATRQAKIAIRLGYVDRVLMIAAEAASDPCLHRTLARHFGLHLHADEDAVTRFLPELKEAIEGDLLARTVPAARSVEEAKFVTAAVVQEWLGAALDRLEARQRSEGRRVDSGEELLRLHQACEGRARELAGGGRTP